MKTHVIARFVEKKLFKANQLINNILKTKDHHGTIALSYFDDVLLTSNYSVFEKIEVNSSSFSENVRLASSYPI